MASWQLYVQFPFVALQNAYVEVLNPHVMALGGKSLCGD